MSASPSSPDGSAPGRPEWQQALLTYGPAVVVAFLLEWALRTQWDFSQRRALLTGIAAGIAVALLLQRAVARRGRS